MSTIKNLYVVLARDVSTDAVDQMNSITKIIDRFGLGYDPVRLKEQGVTLGEKPILFPARYSVATSWYFGDKLPKDTFLTFKVRIKDPHGQYFDGPTQEHLVPPGIDRINMNLNMEGLPVTLAGKYTIVVEVFAKDGKSLGQGEYPFEVDLQTGSEAEQLRQKDNS